MFESTENIQSVDQGSEDVTSVEPTEPTQSQSVEQEQEQPSESQDTPKTSREINFERLRERNEELVRKLEAYEKQSSLTPQNKADQYTPNIDYGKSGYSDDDLITGKDLRNYEQKLADQQRELQRMRLHSQFNDYGSVVNESNIKIFAQLYPSEAAAISASTADDYTRGSALYNMIKSAGIASNQQQSFKKEEKILEQNQQKPKSSAAFKGAPQSPLNSAHLFADDDDWSEERMDAIREYIRKIKNR